MPQRSPIHHTLWHRRREQCEHERKARFDEQRLGSRERGYDREWRRLRGLFLYHHPMCSVPGCGRPATDVDHVKDVRHHARVLAAQSLGLAQVPVIVARGWSDAQKRAYVIADNKLSLNASRDDELLALELGELRDIGFDLGLTGFEAGELHELFAKADLRAGRTDPDQVPEVSAVAFTRPGDVWLLGCHRLICGDCTNAPTVAALLGEARPHLMVTDPPYGVDYARWRLEAGVNKPHQVRAEGRVENDGRANWREACALFGGDVAYVWHASTRSDFVAESPRSQDFEMRALLIWAKSSLVIGRGHYHHQREPCWYAVRKGRTGHWQGDRKQSTLWQIPNVHRTQGDVDDKRTNHSTQKPVEAMLRPMLNNSRAGEALYEPFMGSGTTLIAAEQSGRRCFGVELNPIYVDVAVERWEDFTGERAVRAGDGARFKRRQHEDRTEDPAAGDQAAARHPSDHALPTEVPEGVGELWAPPEWFDETQRAQWDYALENAPPGLLTGTDREVLAIWCVAAVEHARAVQEVRRRGQVVKTRDGNVIHNPVLPIVNRQALIMLRAGAEMGFGPSARMSLGRPPETPGVGGRYIGASQAGRSKCELDAYLDDKPDRLNS